MHGVAVPPLEGARLAGRAGVREETKIPPPPPPNTRRARLVPRASPAQRRPRPYRASSAVIPGTPRHRGHAVLLREHVVELLQRRGDEAAQRDVPRRSARCGKSSTALRFRFDFGLTPGTPTREVPAEVDERDAAVPRRGCARRTACAAGRPTGATPWGRSRRACRVPSLRLAPSR